MAEIGATTSENQTASVSLDTSLYEIGLPKHIVDILVDDYWYPHKIWLTVGELLEVSDENLLRKCGIGPVSIKEIDTAMANVGHPRTEVIKSPTAADDRENPLGITMQRAGLSNTMIRAVANATGKSDPTIQDAVNTSDEVLLKQLGFGPMWLQKLRTAVTAITAQTSQAE